MTTYIITTHDTSFTTYEIEADSVEQAREYLEEGDCKSSWNEITDYEIIAEREL